jgi:uncharacterized repeat protein (TIGR01451 family)
LGLQVDAEDWATVNVISPAIALKITSHYTTVRNGEPFTFTYHVTNTGDATLTRVTVRDDDVTVCEDIVLAAGTAQSCTHSVALSQTTTHTASVSAQDPLGREVGDSDSITINVISPAMAIEIRPHQTIIDAGEPVTLTYQITNTGDTTLTDVRVSDGSGTVCENITLAIGAAHSCARSTILGQTTITTATVTGKDPLGQDVTANDSITVFVRPEQGFSIYLPLGAMKIQAPTTRSTSPSQYSYIPYRRDSTTKR